MNRIALRNLKKSFPRPDGNGQLTIFQNLNLEVEAGETLAVVGPSGCGKTTLLNMIALLEPCDSGQVLFDGQQRSPTEVGSISLGYLFQRDALFPWRTAWGNALLGLACRRRITQESKAIAAGYFQRFGLKGFERAWPRSLSGGQRQRVALIQNLLLDPEVLLLDEPFGSLDYQQKLDLEKELLGVIRAENGNGQRKTVIFVTHDIEEAIVLADRVIVLGLPPRGIVSCETVELPPVLRDPVAARQSKEMQRLFGRIWAQLQPTARATSDEKPGQNGEGEAEPSDVGELDSRKHHGNAARMIEPSRRASG